MHNSKFTLNMAKFMVMLAFAATVILGIEYAVHKAVSLPTMIAFIGIAVACAVGETISWHNFAASWHERRAGAMLMWSVLGAGLSLGTFYTNFSSAANNAENVAVVKTADFNVYDNTKSDLLAARATLKTKEERLAWMNGTAVRGKAVGTLEGADAKITEAKAHKFWKTTNGCTETKGPQTREFCKNYADDQQEKALALEKRTLETDVEGLRSRIAKLSSNVNQKVAISTDAANITAVASWFKVDNAQARLGDNALLSTLAQLMMSLGAMLIAHEMCRHLPRKPWFTGKLWAAFRSKWHELNGNTTYNHSTINQPISPQQALESGVARLKQSFAGA